MFDELVKGDGRLSIKHLEGRKWRLPLDSWASVGALVYKRAVDENAAPNLPRMTLLTMLATGSRAPDSRRYARGLLYGSLYASNEKHS